MNLYISEMIYKLYIMIFLHMLLFLFTFIGGFFSTNTSIIIMLIILPIIYMSQTMYFHPIIRKKIQYIMDNNIQSPCLIHLNEYDIQHAIKMARFDNIPEKKVIDAFITLRCIENKFIIPKLRYYGLQLFEGSFSNPFSPQGMVILAYIINSFILVKQLG